MKGTQKKPEEYTGLADLEDAGVLFAEEPTAGQAIEMAQVATADHEAYWQDKERPGSVITRSNRAKLHELTKCDA